MSGDEGKKANRLPRASNECKRGASGGDVSEHSNTGVYQWVSVFESHKKQPDEATARNGCLMLIAAILMESERLKQSIKMQSPVN